METTATIARRVPPGPSSWPLVGNMLDMRAAGDIAAYFDSLWQTHGDTFRFKLFGTNGVVVTHPEALKQVLSTHRDRYAKGKIYSSAREMLGDGLVTLDGDAWKARRTLAQPAFHRQSLAKLTTIMTRSGAEFLDELAVRAGDAPLEVDFQREMVKLTLDVVVAALMGPDPLRGADVPFEVLGSALELMSERGNGVVLPAWIPTPGNLKFRRTLRELHGMINAIIGRARQRGHDDGSLLSMLLSATDADTGKPLGDDEVRDEVLTLFFAGHETTALTLTWMFTLLDGRPRVLERMRHEVDDTLQGRDPTFEDIAKLPYLRQVVEETLRLRPPAPIIPRNVQEDEIGGYRVSPGDVVFMFFWGTHRHRDFWPDPETFDPDRFAAEQKKNRHSWSFIPFSGGPRTCIGNMFTLVETSVLLAQLLSRFDVEVLPCKDVRPMATATMRPSRPVSVILRRRRTRHV